MHTTIGCKASLGFLGALLGLLAALSFHGCAMVAEHEVRGSGQVVQEQREVGAATGVALMTFGDLEIEVADRAGLTIEAEDNVMAQIVTQVIDGVLHIRQRDKVILAPTRPVRFHLVVLELQEIILTARGRVSVPRLETDRLNVRHSGSGQIEVGILGVDFLAVHSSGSGDVALNRVKARRCRLINSGSGDTKIEYLEGLASDVRLTGSGNAVISGGSVVEQNAFVSGSGELKADRLHSTETEVMVSGCGGASVHAQDLLDATITGTGDIRFRGDPQVYRVVSGKGRLQPI
ncbi:GIN domain-containing protein [Candidatus Eisenbacteria bacterium]|uniref:GIN domain-containing protein n=1 Tax=Eiseniibacteriota bacterium TaxID=2212470 RepID=A0ABV6YJV2_UNCEI